MTQVSASIGNRNRMIQNGVLQWKSDGKVVFFLCRLERLLCEGRRTSYSSDVSLAKIAETTALCRRFSISIGQELNIEQKRNEGKKHIKTCV